ncbi:MAG: hypothetical protein LBF54_00635 [Holosporaceae bacterium]|jgi:Flp pilus assembly protein CpaB|nr:hypothetical protein [Holosporaceae bacterium]
MNGKKDVLPMIIASGIALVVTGIVRLLISEDSDTSDKSQIVQKELSMPDIPLMVKQTKKGNEGQILMVSKDIKKDSKIVLDNLTWKRWPNNAMQPYFIAKDESGTALNNGADYDNALKMWAISDIPAGVPLTMRMLTNENPEQKRKKEEEEKKKKEEQEQIKKEGEKKTSQLIKKGMRAVTFAIDQKSANSSSMLSPGDFVDVLIMEQMAEKVKTHKYKALRILAIDGMTSFESKHSKSGLGSIGGLLTPKNVTLEIKEARVEEMIKRAGNSGVILSVRNQKEAKFVDDDGEEIEENEDDHINEALLQNIIDMNRMRSAETLKIAQTRKEAEEENLSMLISSMNSIGNSSKNALEESQKRKEAEEMNLSMILKNINSASGNDVVGRSYDKEKLVKNEKTGKYEIVSGKIVGEEQESEGKSVVIYRKLKANEVQFGEDGKKIDGKDAARMDSSSSTSPLRSKSAS